MSKGEYNIILQAIEQTCNAHKEGIKSVLLSVEANAIVFGKDLKDIKDHLGELNGTVAELKRESDKRALVVAEFREHQKFGQWCKRNWWVLSLLFIGSVTLIFVVLERFGLIGVLEAVKEVKDIL